MKRLLLTGTKRNPLVESGPRKRHGTIVLLIDANHCFRDHRPIEAWQLVRVILTRSHTPHVLRKVRTWFSSNPWYKAQIKRYTPQFARARLRQKGVL